MTKTAIMRELCNIRNELDWLSWREQQHNPDWCFRSVPYSKHRARLVKSYWGLQSLQRQTWLPHMRTPLSLAGRGGFVLLSFLSKAFYSPIQISTFLTKLLNRMIAFMVHTPTHTLAWRFFVCLSSYICNLKSEQVSDRKIPYAGICFLWHKSQILLRFSPSQCAPRITALGLHWI